MKPLTSLLIALLLASTAFSQTDSIALIAYWKKGESQTFKINKKSVQTKNGMIVEQDSSSYSVRISVIDSTENSYHLDWQGASPLTTTAGRQPVVDRIIMDKYRNLSIRYSTDELGSFNEITNAQEIVNLMNDILDNLPLPETDSTNASIMKQTMASFREVYNTREGMEGLLLKELKLLHWPYGLWYHQGDTLHYEEELPGILNGLPIGGQGKVYLDGIDTVSALCRIRNEVVLDAESLKLAITTFLGDILNKSTFKSAQEREAKLAEFKKSFGELNMSMKRESVFAVDYVTGWPLSVQFTQTITATEQKEGETTKIETLSIDLL